MLLAQIGLPDPKRGLSPTANGYRNLRVGDKALPSRPFQPEKLLVDFFRALSLLL